MQAMRKYGSERNVGHSTGRLSGLSNPAVIPGALRRFFDFLAKMGLTIRDDPPKTIDVNAKNWGAPVDGFVLSACLISGDDATAPPIISIVLRNVSASPATLRIPSWLFFYQIEITRPDGSHVPLTTYGRELLKPERNTVLQTVSLEPGGFAETQVPPNAVFTSDLHAYKLSVSCKLPTSGNVLRAETLIM